MAKREKDEAQFSEKVTRILEALRSGKSREEVAEEEGYASGRSLDTFLRRNGFRNPDGDYIPKDMEGESVVPEWAGSKEYLIITMFATGHSPKEIAKSVGLEDHRRLSDYMNSRGYVWDAEARNYRPGENGREGEGRDDDEENETVRDREPAGGRSVRGDVSELLEYLPLLRRLDENREKLEELLEEGLSSGKIPHYSVSGNSMTKSIYMSRKMSVLIEEFSSARNVSQRQIVEAALIEFFQRHGYSDEVDSILG